METYPASEYGYDPEISFEEWIQEYFDLIAIPGIPTTSGYYKTGDRYFSPFNLYIGETTDNVHTYSDESEFDWWNISTIADQYPFKYW